MISQILSLFRHRASLKMALSCFLRIQDGIGNADQLGSLSEEELKGLISWLPDEGTFVEFGTLFGLTAKAVASAKPKLKILAVDNFSWNPFGLPPKVHEAFTRRVLANEIATGQVFLLNTTSESFRSKAADHQRLVKCDAISAVFFDAQHQYESVKAEIDWAKKLGIPCIAGHDYNNPSPVFGVTRAVDEAFPSGIILAGMCWRAKGVR